MAVGRDRSPSRPFADGGVDTNRVNGGLGEPALPKACRLLLPDAREDPGFEFGFGVGFFPGVVAHAGIDGELHVGAILLGGLDGDLPALERD